MLVIGRSAYHEVVNDHIWPILKVVLDFLNPWHIRAPRSANQAFASPSSVLILGKVIGQTEEGRRQPISS